MSRVKRQPQNERKLFASCISARRLIILTNNSKTHKYPNATSPPTKKMIKVSEEFLKKMYK